MKLEPCRLNITPTKSLADEKFAKIPLVLFFPVDHNVNLYSGEYFFGKPAKAHTCTAMKEVIALHETE